MKLNKKQKVLLIRFLKSINVFNIGSILRSVKQFDKVTEFRLINAFFVALSFNVISPVLITLKGLYMLPWIIGIFSILNMLAAKTNEFITYSMTTDQIYKSVVLLHVVFSVTTSLYFYNPVLMIYLDSILGVVEIILVSAYSIKLNNYIAKHFSDSMNKFQIIRNSIWADGSLIGLFASSVVLFIAGLKTVLILFIVLNLLFSLWLMLNWNFYENNEKIK